MGLYSELVRPALTEHALPLRTYQHSQYTRTMVRPLGSSAGLAVLCTAY